MSSAEAGAFLGLCGGLGTVAVFRWAPPLRRPRLADRVLPYLGVAVEAAGGGVVRSLGRLVGFGRAAGLGEGSRSLRRRLDGLGTLTVEAFRLEQLTWAIIGLLGAGGAVAFAGRSPVLVVLSALAGLSGGFVGRDWWLGRQLARRRERQLAELPVLADLLALAVIAGESVVDALVRVCRITNGELARDLREPLARARSGTTLAVALGELADRSAVEPVSRFVRGIAVTLERGTPLAGVIRAQSADVRELTKRLLLESGGRKEISMMLPVVFLILPVTVVFALYPGVLTLTSLAR